MRRRNRGKTGTGNRLGAVMMGALAGMAVGVLLADRGLLSGLLKRRQGAAADPKEEVPRARSARSRAPAEARPRHGERSPRKPVDDEAELEARVLETFRNDPILVDLPIDIGAIGTGIIELTGWVGAREEIRHATTLTRGTIGVHTVINRLVVRGGAPAA